MNNMVILHASHISNYTPPQGYGGIELVVDILARYLVKRGFGIQVMGVKNPYTETPYHFVNVFEKPVKKPSIKHKTRYIAKLLMYSTNVDIVHLHVQWLSTATPILRSLNKPVILTLHADIGKGLVSQIVKKFDVKLIAISHTQRERMESRGFRVYDVIYHGVEVEKYPFTKDKEDYLVYLGRIDYSKGVHIAVRVARKAGEKLIIIGPIADEKYFEHYIKPYVDDNNIRYIGEVDFKTKVEYLSKAKAMIYPVQYEEFFGIAMVEALACGTPVIGFRRGSVEEIVKNGVTGYAVTSEDDMITAIKNIDRIDPWECRRDAEERFSAQAMTLKYERLYWGVK